MNLVENDVAFPVAKRICEGLAERLDKVQIKRFEDRKKVVEENLREVLLEILLAESKIDLLSCIGDRRKQGEPLVILAPESELDAPIVATAWRMQLNLEDASDERLVQFLRRYQRGPFTPEPGASCTGGVGEPLI